ncbi:MAG: aspartate kinase [Bacillota bacterium]
MSLIVQKYGGSSLADSDKIKNVAERVIKKYKEGNQVIVVASAMGDTTDNLIEQMEEITENPDPRERDMLLCTGEQISIALLSMALQKEGVPAISLTGSQVKIKTDDTYNRAEILQIDDSRIKKELAEEKIVVVAGFQGVNSRNDYTTLGRGGSDTTAVALACALEAERCEIYSDVEGIFTADPRIVNKAQKLKSISYEEMLELANLGANVLHPRSVELAKYFGLELYLASSFNYKPGTIVKEVEKMEDRNNVTGVTSDCDVVKITVEGVPDKPGMAGKLFSRLAEKGINVDMIIQNLQHNNKNDITFTICEADLQKCCSVLDKISDSISADKIETDQDVAKVSIVGAGMISTPGIAAKMFATLGQEEINIQKITTSDIKISCLIKENSANRAVKAIHDSFELESIS